MSSHLVSEKARNLAPATGQSGPGEIPPINRASREACDATFCPATSYPTFSASQFPTSAAGIGFGPTSDYRFPYPMTLHPRERPGARPSPFPHRCPGQHPALIRPPLPVIRPPSARRTRRHPSPGDPRVRRLRFPSCDRRARYRTPEAAQRCGMWDF